MAKSVFESISVQLEAIGKAVVVVAGVAYSIGVVLVSFDLAQYRVANFSLARSQYILVGAVWLILTLIALVPPFLAAWFIKYAAPTRVKRAFLVLMLVGFCVWLLNAAVQFLEPDGSLQPRIYYPSLVFVELLVFGLSMHAFAENARIEQTTPHGGGTLASRWMPFATIYGLMVLTFWTGLYMDVFRSVESSRGGARHPKAHVVFRQPEQSREKELKDALGSLGLEGLKTKESVTVVLADADFIVLVSEEQHTDAVVNRIVSRPIWKLITFDETNEPWKPVLVNKLLVASIQYD